MVCLEHILFQTKYVAPSPSMILCFDCKQMKPYSFVHKLAQSSGIFRLFSMASRVVLSIYYAQQLEVSIREETVLWEDSLNLRSWIL